MPPAAQESRACGMLDVCCTCLGNRVNCKGTLEADTGWSGGGEQVLSCAASALLKTAVAGLPVLDAPPPLWPLTA